MIISKTPFRMSFFGGGTDVKEFFDEFGGKVISTTFDKYCYVNVRYLPPFFDYRTELAYSKIERVSDVDSIMHPAIRNAMKMLNMQDLRLTYEADLPARSGLGSSSSFAVGMLNAFYSLQGKFVDKKKLAEEAIYLERVLCNETGGWQDQVAASFGGLNIIHFNSDGFEVDPLIISPARKKTLNNHLLLFFTGFTRFSSEIHDINSKYNKAEKISCLKEMLSLTDSAERVLTDKNSDIDEFGKLLDYEWKLKKKTGSAITTGKIDDIYARGIKAGALGGKLLGAGGGGFFVFYVEPEKQKSVRESLSDLMYIPFEFEDSGSKVIYYSPETCCFENGKEYI